MERTEGLGGIRMYFGKVVLRSFLARHSAGTEGGGSSLGAHSGLPLAPIPPPEVRMAQGAPELRGEHV